MDLTSVILGASKQIVVPDVVKDINKYVTYTLQYRPVAHQGYYEYIGVPMTSNPAAQDWAQF